MIPYSIANQIKVEEEIHKLEKVDSDILSYAHKRTLKTSSRSHQYNLSSNQKQAQNAEALAPSERSEQHHFITLGKISEDEKIEVIKTRSKAPSERSEQAFVSIKRIKYP